MYIHIIFIDMFLDVALYSASLHVFIMLRCKCQVTLKSENCDLENDVM